jgi:hypothetical protein
MPHDDDGRPLSAGPRGLGPEEGSPAARELARVEAGRLQLDPITGDESPDGSLVAARALEADEDLEEAEDLLLPGLEAT